MVAVISRDLLAKAASTWPIKLLPTTMIPRTAELPRLEGKNLLRFYYFYLFNSKKNIFRFIIRDDYGMPDDKGTSKKPAVEKPKPKEPPKELPSIKKISLADSQGSHSDVELEWNSDSGHRDDEDSSSEEENTEDDYQIEEEEPTYAILLFIFYLFYSYLLFYRAKGKEKVTQKGKGTQPTTGPQPGGYVLLRLSPNVGPQQPSPVMSPGEFFSSSSLSFVSPHPLFFSPSSLISQTREASATAGGYRRATQGASVFPRRGYGPRESFQARRLHSSGVLPIASRCQRR